MPIHVVGWRYWWEGDKYGVPYRTLASGKYKTAGTKLIYDRKIKKKVTEWRRLYKPFEEAAGTVDILF